MKNTFFTAVLLGTLLIGSSCTMQVFASNGNGNTTTINKKDKKEKKKKKCKKEKAKINWISITEAEALAAKEPRRIIVDIYADWCGWCKKMDKTTFQHPDIVEYINEKYYAVKLDAEMKETVTVGGHDYKYIKQGRRGAHELAATLLEGQMSLPSVVVLEADLSKLTIIPGYMEPKMMDQALHYFGDGFFDKGIKWPIFEKNYKSRIKGANDKPKARNKAKGNR